MSKEFKCIKQFNVNKYDEYEQLVENEEIIIPVDSIWETQYYSSVYGIRLINDELGWLEISDETLADYFMIIK